MDSCLVIACQQCSRELVLQDWFPFGPEDRIRNAFCGKECRAKWLAGRLVHSIGDEEEE